MEPYLFLTGLLHYVVAGYVLKGSSYLPIHPSGFIHVTDGTTLSMIGAVASVKSLWPIWIQAEDASVAGNENARRELLWDACIRHPEIRGPRIYSTTSRNALVKNSAKIEQEDLDS